MNRSVFHLLCLLVACLVTPSWAHPPDTFRKVAREATGAVVSIHTAGVRNAAEDLFKDPVMREFFSQDAAKRGQETKKIFTTVGSGFAFGQGEYVVTEHSVVDNGETFRVSTRDGRELPAQLVAKDAQSSIALLKVPGLNLPLLPLGDEDIAQGDWVMAIGAPFGMTHSVSVGVISAVSRTVDDFNVGARFIQSDVTIQPGSSGGPLLDDRGRVLGMSVAILSRSGRHEGVSLFIPAQDIRFIADQLRQYGRVKRAWLGINITDLAPDLANALSMTGQRGAVVSQVEADSPAEAAGLRVGDVIQRFNSTSVPNANTIAYLTSHSQPNSVVRLAVIRDGKPLDVSITLSELPPGPD